MADATARKTGLRPDSRYRLGRTSRICGPAISAWKEVHSALAPGLSEGNPYFLGRIRMRPWRKPLHGKVFGGTFVATVIQDHTREERERGGNQDRREEARSTMDVDTPATHCCGDHRLVAVVESHERQ